MLINEMKSATHPALISQHNAASIPEQKIQPNKSVNSTKNAGSIIFPLKWVCEGRSPIITSSIYYLNKWNKHLTIYVACLLS